MSVYITYNTPCFNLISVIDVNVQQHLSLDTDIASKTIRNKCLELHYVQFYSKFRHISWPANYQIHSFWESRPREGKERKEGLTGNCIVLLFCCVSCNNNSADPTAAIRGSCFISWGFRGQGWTITASALVQLKVQLSSFQRFRQSHRVRSLILLMYLWIISFVPVDMGVGALYRQYYVDVRQWCCYYYKNTYSFWTCCFEL